MVMVSVHRLLFGLLKGTSISIAGAQVMEGIGWLLILAAKTINASLVSGKESGY